MRHPELLLLLLDTNNVYSSDTFLGELLFPFSLTTNTGLQALSSCNDKDCAPGLDSLVPYHTKTIVLAVCHAIHPLKACEKDRALMWNVFLIIYELRDGSTEEKPRTKLGGNAGLKHL